MKNIKQILNNILNIFIVSIAYFIIFRLVALSTYTLFPKFNEKRVLENGKPTMLVEAILELGLITVIIYIIREILIYSFSSFNISYIDAHDKFVFIVLAPALYFGNSDLKKKLDYGLS